MMNDPVQLNGQNFTLGQLIDIAREGRTAAVSVNSETRIKKARALVEDWVKKGTCIYGVTTGFGALSDVPISFEDTKTLQRNILVSHAAGVGNCMDDDVVRAMMALRINDFCRGNSGLRLETIKILAHVLNAGIIPVVPEKGSVGASGDLVPMAHLSLVLIGEGEAFVDGVRMPGARALAAKNIEPLELGAGEGLALINGTQFMLALGCLALYDALNLCKHADIAASMSLETLMGTRTAFDPRIHNARPHLGQMKVASDMMKITQNSEIISSHRDCSRVQDAYTLRCSPQVHGASWDAFGYVDRVIRVEMNASTENPLIFPESGEFLSGGNFHGQPLALACDFLGIAIAELANISERRIERLVNPQLSGLPAFLVKDTGLNSGFMIAQYVAASLVSENKVLAHPASVDSIPTSANKEDHVSMGAIAARKCRDIVENTEQVIAIELLCGAQAIDMFTNLKAGKGTMAAYETIRSKVPCMTKDRFLAADIAVVRKLLHSGRIVRAVEDAVGKLY
ncbi:histidine ammonia-lyase [Desulfobacter hydrogenophilus]|uniref:Histidine ammonia-lyase n=1 Tax=Desulfobacter hydrogenophilus TaxID=2291 RepID=A0A328FFY9_9BACT|nr:histidine ammonia-lyase [Desulfobacter hydrogenophilus]NDY70669.1 histidine ammonia-lyase [Desulfobacter hydrogenophilus]QBH14032.1 histidine ammonia-lyase [Desulfobacter hydrogenophilus]RAM03551.1 histidine ammonia-lyase [Desulfobacter hydrogenophilus]